MQNSKSNPCCKAIQHQLEIQIQNNQNQQKEIKVLTTELAHAESEIEALQKRITELGHMLIDRV